MFAIFETEEERISGLNESNHPIHLTGRIKFKDLSFAYPSRSDIPVLKDINLIIEPGSMVALAGKSGAGKSTFAALLLHLYEPTEGDIWFDDQKITKIDLTLLRKQIALVPQDIFLFGGTIKENIAYGKPEASDEEILEAATQANAIEFIERFPEKMDTLVGERGTQLSGGQRQRIAIARAILKDPKILILDEATSSLDSESEQLVQNALERLMINRTSVVIAHRLSTIRKANKIVVLDGGRIVETGTHEELMNNEASAYRLLNEIQFAM